MVYTLICLNMDLTKSLYIHKFYRDDMEDDYWIEYVISTSSEISSEWRDHPLENKTVIDWAESSDIFLEYPNAVKINFLQQKV